VVGICSAISEPIKRLDDSSAGAYNFDMRFRHVVSLHILLAGIIVAQTNPLWHEQKVKNYLPHMTGPEVQELLGRTDVVIIPIGSLEQHGPQLPAGTDYLSGLERAKLIA